MQHEIKNSYFYCFEQHNCSTTGPDRRVFLLQDHRGSDLQRAEDTDGDELHAVRRADLLL